MALASDKPCAVASTVAHDSHHLIIAGTDAHNMAVAANTLAECGGGMCVVLHGEVRALVALPIAGLMSDQRANIVADQVGKTCSPASAIVVARLTAPICSSACSAWLSSLNCASAISAWWMCSSLN